jgi:hypothetical protein
MGGFNQKFSLATSSDKTDAKSLILAFNYKRELDGLEEPVSEETQTFLRVGHDETYEVEGIRAGSVIELGILSTSGVLLGRRAFSAETPVASIDIDLNTAELSALNELYERRPQPDRIVRRRARLSPITDSRPDFSNSTLNVAPISLETDWDAFSLANRFGIETPSATSIPLVSGEPTPAANWQKVDLSLNGQFEARFIENAGNAWLWWLNGPRPALGLIVEDISQEISGELVIPLPLQPEGLEADEGASCWSSNGTTPKDIDEQDLADNPGVFSEDPGEYCRPFKNPERILSERGFNVILRVDQPAISGELAYRYHQVEAGQIATQRANRLAAQPAAETPSLLTRMASWFGNASVQRATLAPSLDLFNRNWLGSLTFFPTRTGRGALSASNPMEWEGDTSKYYATTIARGHILEFRTRWRLNGYSLGRVAKTLSLAPRQAKWIETIDFDRNERSKREEKARFAEQTSDRVDQQRAYDNSVTSSLKEWSAASSANLTTSASAGLGFLGSGFVFGGGASTGFSASAAGQMSGRTTEATERQRLSDSIRRYGDSLRENSNMVVQEVSQHETVTGSKEMVYNPNYGHSLTIVYHQINRHLKVDTDFAGVRECLFVPLSMKPFDQSRILRWRDTLSAHILEKSYAGAIRYMADIVDNFQNSEIQPGARADETLTRLRGSIYIDLAIERPGGDEDEFDGTVWSQIQRLMKRPPRGVFERMKAQLAERRDAYFQEKIAPEIARSWAEKLVIGAFSSNLMDVSTRLASNYSYGETVRIDFDADFMSGPNLTRRDLSALIVRSGMALTPGSHATLKRVDCKYASKRHKRSITSSKVYSDLMDAEDGSINSSISYATFPLDDWESYNERDALREAAAGLVVHLNEHIEYYHKLIWWNMDRDRLYMMLDGFYVPGMDKVSVASVVEREPIGIAGNCLVFRVASGAFIGWGEYDTPERLYNFYYNERQPARDSLHIAIPTPGLYAQALMDECQALEEHRGDTSWVLTDKHPLLESFDTSLMASRRADTPDLSPTDFPPTLINLQNAPTPPAPSGFAGAYSVLGKSGIFPDITGLEGNQQNVRTAMDITSKLADSFGSKALGLSSSMHATDTANQKLDSIGKAKDKGLIDDDKAKDLATNALQGMSTPQSNSASGPGAGPVGDLIASADPGFLGSVYARDQDYEVDIQNAQGTGSMIAAIVFYPTSLSPPIDDDLVQELGLILDLLNGDTSSVPPIRQRLRRRIATLRSDANGHVGVAFTPKKSVTGVPLQLDVEFEGKLKAAFSDEIVYSDAHDGHLKIRVLAGTLGLPDAIVRELGRYIRANSTTFVHLSQYAI